MEVSKIGFSASSKSGSLTIRNQTFEQKQQKRLTLGSYSESQAQGLSERHELRFE